MEKLDLFLRETEDGKRLRQVAGRDLAQVRPSLQEIPRFGKGVDGVQDGVFGVWLRFAGVTSIHGNKAKAGSMHNFAIF